MPDDEDIREIRWETDDGQESYRLRGNEFLVSVGGDRFENITVLRPPPFALDRDRALEFAAWIVTLADRGDGHWEAILEAVHST